MVAGMIALAIALVGCGRVGFDADDRGLVARYLMDDDPSDGADDATGHGHTARCTACPSLVPGHTGSAYLFDGVSHYLEVPPAVELAPMRGVTLAAWLNPLSNAGTDCVVGKSVGTLTLNSWQICISDMLRLIGCVGYDGALVSDACTGIAATVAVGTWQHVALTYDGTRMRVWYGTQVVIDKATTLGYDDHAIMIGVDVDNGLIISFFDGMIDDIRIWDHALSDAEVEIEAGS